MRRTGPRLFPMRACGRHFRPLGLSFPAVLWPPIAKNWGFPQLTFGSGAETAPQKTAGPTAALDSGAGRVNAKWHSFMHFYIVKWYFAIFRTTVDWFTPRSRASSYVVLHRSIACCIRAFSYSSTASLRDTVPGSGSSLCPFPVPRFILSSTFPVISSWSEMMTILWITFSNSRIFPGQG